jgi:hypothetical protein
MVLSCARGGEWPPKQLDLEGLSAHGREGAVDVERKGGGDHAGEIEIRTPERGSRPMELT